MNVHKIAGAVALAMASNVLIADANAAFSEENPEIITVEGSYLGSKKANSFKTPTLLIDTPSSISVISRQQIDDQNFMDMADVLLYTPGVSIGQGENHRDQFTIRGQNTTADFFVDGMRDDVQYFRPLYNLERVEILRGSNALLFGRGGGGGVINRVTKTAQFDRDFTHVQGNINTFGAGMMTVDTNVTLSERDAFRFNALYEGFDNHRDFNRGERFAFNPTYTFNVTDATSVLFSYEYINDERFVDRGIPSLNGRPLEGQRDTFFGDRDLNETTFEGHITKLRVDHIINDEWKVDGTIQLADFDKYYANIYPAGYNADTNIVTFDGYNDTQDRNNFFTQVNFVGEVKTGDIEHTLLIGFEAGDQDSVNIRQEANFPGGPVVDGLPFIPRGQAQLTDPIVAPQVELIDPIRNTGSHVKFTSLFIQDEISITDNWSIVAGLRYDKFDINVVDFIQVGIDNGTIPEDSVFSSENYAAVAGDGNDGFLGREDTEVSPRLGVIYEYAENLSFYASLSRSFLPRSGDQFLSLNLTTEALGPEEFENREIGVKWDITPVLSFTAAVFELERESGVEVDPNDPERSILVGTETRGFELQLVGYINDQWSVNAGYSYLDANEMGRVQNGRFANRTLSQVPEQMASVWTRYDMSDELGFGLGVTHQGAQFTSLSNNVELPSFTRVDAAVYYSVNSQLDVQLNIENLLDEEYFPAAHNDNNITTGEPLNARFTVNYRF